MILNITANHTKGTQTSSSSKLYKNSSKHPNKSKSYKQGHNQRLLFFSFLPFHQNLNSYLFQAPFVSFILLYLITVSCSPSPSLSCKFIHLASIDSICYLILFLINFSFFTSPDLSTPFWSFFSFIASSLFHWFSLSTKVSPPVTAKTYHLEFAIKPRRNHYNYKCPSKDNNNIMFCCSALTSFSFVILSFLNIYLLLFLQLQLLLLLLVLTQFATAEIRFQYKILVLVASDSGFCVSILAKSYSGFCRVEVDLKPTSIDQWTNNNNPPSTSFPIFFVGILFFLLFNHQLLYKVSTTMYL